ncbi:MAG: hypothetical protein JXA04_03865 [Gammaproteobacteria bacterium]|nr:hypothetical protein [Gammaproteobacteria bacterium]
MKSKTLITSLALILCAFLVQPVNAGELLIGAKAGVIDPDFDYTDNDDPFAAVTLGIGYEFLDLVAADIGAELEYTNSVADGKAFPSDLEYSYDSLGLIFSLRTAGPIYFIGRAGYVDQNFEYDSGTIEHDATVVGAGIGFSTGLRWEIQLDSYSYGDGKADGASFPNNGGSAYYLTVGLSF